ncbi:MAG TPA: hypothetical protein VMU94_17655 [Streptosporangiaceae bacterium]|nr:hypothetical protein [Streptosporangiaceae bacterium]
MYFETTGVILTLVVLGRLTKRGGDTVVGATINTTGSLRVRAAKVGADTMLAQIIKMVQQAQASKAPIQRLADLVSGFFVPAVMVIAIATFAVWFTVGPAPAVRAPSTPSRTEPVSANL